MKKIVLFDIDYTLFDTDEFKKSNLTVFKLYEEAESVLEELIQSCEVGIFSEGKDEFQREKLRQTLIHGRFQEKNIHIFLSKDDNIESVLQKHRGDDVFLVDDKLAVLSLAKNLDNNTFVIWVKRGPFAMNEENNQGFVPDATVSNLSEIIPLILGY